MNIWLINHYANSPDEPGDARHWSHARELISRGHRVTVISSSFHHLKHEQIKSVSRGKTVHQLVEGVPFVWMPTIGYQSDSVLRVAGFFEFGYRVWRANWATGLSRPDLIVGSSPHPFAALGAERLAAHYGVPFILELRDAWPYVLTEVGGYSKHHPFVILVDWTMRFLYKRAARIILFSRDSSESLAEMGGDPGKVVWVPHGVDLTLTPEPLPAPDDGIFTIKYIGAHNQWNSLDAILDAAKYLQEKGVEKIDFRFIGDGVQKPHLKARVEKEGIFNAHFDDPVPKNKISEVLYDADAFILNNRVDGVSKRWMSFNKIYEYLAARRPVVFGSCTKINPVQESGAGLLVEAGNHIEIAQAVEMLACMSREQLDSYGLRGRQHIEAHYSIKSIVDRFEAMALEVTGQEPKSGAMCPTTTACQVRSHVSGSTIREYFLTTADRELWRRYMPEGSSVYGSLGYAQIAESFLGRVPRLYVVASNHGWIAYPMLLRPLSELPFSVRTSAKWDSTTPEYTGPCIFGDPGTVPQSYLEMRKSLARREGIVAEFAHLHPWSGAEKILEDGSIYNRDIVWVDTTLEPEFLWRNHFRHSCRKCINKAEREGLYTVEASSDDQIAEFIRIYEGTMYRNHAFESYYFSREYFLAFRDRMPDSSRFTLTLYRDRVIGALLTVFDDDTAYTYLGGSDADFYHLRPANLQYWEVIRWAHKTGRKRVVLGGGHAPNDGIFQFKAVFSPLRQPFYIYKKVHFHEEYTRLEQASREFNGLKDEEVAYFPTYRYVKPVASSALRDALEVAE